MAEQVTKVSFYDLGTKEACRKKRFLASLEPEEKREESSEADQEAIDRAFLIRRVACEWAFDLYSILQEDVSEEEKEKKAGELKGRISNEIQTGFDGLQYLIPETRRIAVDDAIRLAERYATCEAARNHMWDLFPVVSRDVPLNDKVTVISLRPDYIDYEKNPALDENGDIIAEGTLRVVRVSSGKPTIKKKYAQTDLQLYALIQYGKQVLRERLKPGHKIQVEGAVYFLRKDNDSDGETPNFDEDFFLEKNGHNIQRETDVYDSSSSERTKKEISFDEIIDGFVEGKDPESLGTSECELCKNYYICHFEAPPVPVAKVDDVKKIDFRKLSKEQRKAVNFTKGVMLINAGAGSGKTVVLSAAPVVLLKQGIRPEEIFMSTFSRSGMEEIGPRTEYNLRQHGFGDDFPKLRIQTLHSFGFECIKKIWKKLGFKEEPSVCEDVDRSAIIAEILVDHPVPGLDYRHPEMNFKNAKGAITMISKIFEIIKRGDKGSPFTKDDLDIVWSKIGKDRRNIKGDKSILKNVFDVFDIYRDKLKENNLVEYSDMEGLIVEYLKKDPRFFDRFGFKHILIDEFQDSSGAQVEILKALCKCPTFESLRVVGDDWQSIGAYRGVTPEHMVNFDKIMAEAGFMVECVNLEKNYRCTPKILKAAMNVISKNKTRLSKDLKPVRRGGTDVKVKGYFTAAEEHEDIRQDILRHINEGVNPGNILVQGRTKYEPESVLKGLDTGKVMKNPNPILDNCRVQAAIALISFMRDPKDKTSLEMYVNAILGGEIFELDRQKISEEKAEVISEIEALSNLKGKEQKDMLLDMIAIVDQDEDEIYQWFYNKLESRRDFSSIVDYIYRLKLYGADVKARRSQYYDEVIGNTCHSSKGTEAKVVYLMTSKFDDSGDGEEEDDEESHVEEMRRLLFVGMTRARDELIITGQYYNRKEVSEDSSGRKHETPLLNQFLGECFEAVGQEYDPQKIAEAKAARDAALKKQKNEDRKARLRERAAQKTG